MIIFVAYNLAVVYDWGKCFISITLLLSPFHIIVNMLYLIVIYVEYILIDWLIDPQGPMIQQIGCIPTDHPLLLSRQRRHFGAPSGSVRRCLYHYQFVYIYFTVIAVAALWIVGSSLHKV